MAELNKSLLLSEQQVCTFRDELLTQLRTEIDYFVERHTKALSKFRIVQDKFAKLTQCIDWQEGIINEKDALECSHKSYSKLKKFVKSLGDEESNEVVNSKETDYQVEICKYLTSTPDMQKVFENKVSSDLKVDKRVQDLMWPSRKVLTKKLKFITKQIYEDYLSPGF